MSSGGMEKALMASTEGGAGVTGGADGLLPAPAAARLGAAQCECRVSKAHATDDANGTCSCSPVIVVLWRYRHLRVHQVSDITRTTRGNAVK